MCLSPTRCCLSGAFSWLVWVWVISVLPVRIPVFSYWLNSVLLLETLMLSIRTNSFCVCVQTLFVCLYRVKQANDQIYMKFQKNEGDLERQRKSSSCTKNTFRFCLSEFSCGLLLNCRMDVGGAVETVQALNEPVLFANTHPFQYYKMLTPTHAIPVSFTIDRTHVNVIQSNWLHSISPLTCPRDTSLSGACVMKQRQCNNKN